MITIDHAAAHVRGGGAEEKVCCPKRGIVDGGGPHLTAETQGLLRSRLRAAAFILLVGFAVFLVRHVVGLFAGEPLDPWLLSFHILVVLVLGVGSLPLCRRHAVSLRGLRFAELIIFGLPAAFFLQLQHRVTLSDAARGFMPPPMSFWLLLIFTYGMFIPNTWRRSALVATAMALAPVLLTLGMSLAYADVASVMTVAGFMEYVLTMGVAAVAAAFGTHLIYRLRREAFEAKQIGQYRLIERLGAGGVGEVYLAEHRMLKRPCAIKLIRPEKAGDPQVLARFEREVRLTAGLSHWNIIEIFDYGRTDDGTFYYVMEYLPGLTLEDLVERHGPLPAERVVHFIRQTCYGLREAHAIGLIHRDIKPGNIFAARRGQQFDVVKLLDFGLVKPVSEGVSARLTSDGAISGTPLFMSPEQARGLGDVDARSDIYSLGAVAYTLLCGRPPFEGANPFDVMVAHARDDVEPPSRWRPDVPGDLESVILRCLSKRPEDRFQDADALEEALARCADADQWTPSRAARWWHDQSHEPAPLDRMSEAVTLDGDGEATKGMQLPRLQVKAKGDRSAGSTADLPERGWHMETIDATPAGQECEVGG
jgi:serine/threonine-protein kinase